MTALVLSVLAASLLGSAHCAGMCGGFVCFYAGDDVTGARARAWAHAAYNAGRLVSYLALGVLAGALGRQLDRVGGLAGLTGAATIVAGAFLTLWGAGRLVAALDPAAWARWRARFTPARTHAPATRVARAPWPVRVVRGVLAGLRAAPPSARALALGLVTTLLPCGWLYAFVATAAGTGSPVRGALVMAAFWAGTVPALAALGLVARGALGPLSRKLPLVTATALVVVGLFTLGSRLSPLHAGVLHAGAAKAPAGAHAGCARAKG